MNLKKSAFFIIRCSLGVFSVFSRSSVGKMREGIREVKETAILTKSTFYISEFLGRSLVLLWFFLGLLPESNREGTREGNLKRSAIFTKASE